MWSSLVDGVPDTLLHDLWFSYQVHIEIVEKSPI
jgi:hypothetical protein